MAWHLTDSIEAYAERVWDLLALQADLNTIALTQIAGARSPASWSGDEPTFAWWSHAGRTSGAVSLTPPFELLLSVVPDGTLEDLVAALRRHVGSVPGVNASPDAATRFAELWTAGTSLSTVETRRLRLYGTAQPVDREPAPAGRARLARADEVDLIVDWHGAFGQEVGDRPVEVLAAVQERVAAGLAWVWEDESGTPTSFATRHQPAAGVSRVGPVYTPPPFRRRGFGAAVTAACTRHALDTDSTTAVLFADLANPTSNAIYQAIGYRMLEDRVVLDFVG
ncbi:MAG: GNAT family N-acetyltransferase [Acidimicrobiales bacterium]|jgi:predicted GNAT family acetyltransferase